MEKLLGLIIPLIVLVGLLRLVLWLLAFSKKSGNKTAIQAKPLLTDNEQEFFHRLQRALPDFHIFPQVAASALLRVAPNTPKSRHYSLFGTFSQKRVDYIVCQRDTLAVRAIIELDDRSHNAKKDAKRDALFQHAGYPVIRFESRRKPSEQQIADSFARLAQPHAFPSTPPQSPPPQSTPPQSLPPQAPPSPAKDENCF